jgi:hypothetical protein
VVNREKLDMETRSLPTNLTPRVSSCVRARSLALLLLAGLAGCDSGESGLAVNSFEVTITGARSTTLRGSAIAGPVTRVDETNYALVFTDFPAGQILLTKRSLGRLAVRTYVVGGVDDEAFGGIVGLGSPPYDLATFATVSGSVVVDRLDGRDAEGRVSIVARSFDGGDEVLVEGTFRVRVPA